MIAKTIKKGLNIIKEKLLNEYKISVNEKKTFIVDKIHGFDFLGYRFKVINKRTIINIKNENIKRMKNNVKLKRHLYTNRYISYINYFNSINVYNNFYKYNNSKFTFLID